MRNFANIFWYVKLFWKQIDFYYSLIARTSADSRCFVSVEQLPPHTIDSSAEIFKYFYYLEFSWHEIETSINLASSPRHQKELPAQILRWWSEACRYSRRHFIWRYVVLIACEYFGSIEFSLRSTRNEIRFLFLSSIDSFSCTCRFMLVQME